MTSEPDLVSAFVQRRTQVNEVEGREDFPSFLDHVEQSVVRYSFRESALPLPQLDVEELIRQLASSEYYETELAPVSLGELVTKYGSDKLFAMTQAQLLDRVFKNDSSKVAVFNGGRFPARHSMTPIQQIRIDRYSVGILAEGTSRIAEAIGQEVVELLWSCAGSRRTFESLKSELMSVHYGTQTIVTLPINLEDLLSEQLKGFVSEELVAGRRLAASMRSIDVADHAANDELAVSVTAETVRLVAYVMNLRTGVADSNTLSFSLPARGDAKTGRVRVSSGLRYDEHVELLKRLLSRYA